MRGKGVQVAGIVVIAVGVVAAIVLWLGAGRRYDDAVTELAPVPLGCTTTLSFDDPGTYTFFVETTGEIGEIDGDCVTDDREYDVDADDAPRVTLTLVDEDGEEVDLDRVDGPSYDRAGRTGAAVRTAEIDDAGDYELTATTTSDEDEVVVRVGRDPASGVTAMRAGSILVLILGVAIGMMLLALGRRRPSPVPTAPSGPQWPTGPLPVRPPLAPPSANPPVPPPYIPRPPSHGPYHAPGPATAPGRGGPLPPPSPPR